METGRRSHETGASPPPTAGGGDGSAGVDWQAAERSEEFRELVRRQRRFILPATVFFFSWYFGFIVLAGYAEGFMGESIYEGFTVGYALALTQFVMTWVLGWLYLRQADRVWDPLRRRAARTAVEAVDAARRRGVQPGVGDASVSHAGATDPLEPAGAIEAQEEQR